MCGLRPFCILRLYEAEVRTLSIQRSCKPKALCLCQEYVLQVRAL